jgi:hypothetical protein
MWTRYSEVDASMLLLRIKVVVLLNQCTNNMFASSGTVRPGEKGRQDFLPLVILTMITP